SFNLDVGLNLKLPILDDPVNSAFRLLLGQDVDLVSLDAKLDLTFAIGAGFNFFGLEFGIRGDLEAHGTFRLAYDTFGLREFITGLERNAGPQWEKLVDGFYVDCDKSKLALKGGVNAIAGLNWGIVGGNITGGVNASLDVSFVDPNRDGKLRFDEFAN